MEAPIKDGVVSSPYPPVELIQDETLYQHIQKRFLEHGDKPALVLIRATEFFEDKDVVLEWNPLTHMCGFVIPMIAFLTGAMVVPSTGGLSPKEFVEIVNKHQVFELESLRNGYGMSEAIGFICMTAPKTTGYRSVGYPVPMAEYKIIDNASGRTLGPLEVGEITFRAPHLMRGYYKRPDETAQVFDEQRWFRSGDAGYYDRTGQLYIVERLKDMIKCLDQQVAPAELEALLTQHPLVLEAAVVGIDHPEFGEAPTAFVVIEPSAKGLVSEDELVRLVSDQTAFHKNLHGGVVFVDIIPKTDTGKYIRRKLRQGHLDLLKKSCYQP
ncbi:hypothetical protein HPB52_008042 [Rhipicephalus sanguineus]|uniref:Luciferin 4-monooxygenase n=1 Tax=Rhipicephalus sanguineus TaxID=34632 RepID=A0A9D4SQG5_RHISA|nr:hypothetical protein HPB52_008042 [Rhipicephalus sanguineus]